MLILILGADERTVTLLDTLRQTGESVHVLGWFDSDAVGDALAQNCPQGNRIGSAEEFASAITQESIVVVGPTGEASQKEKLLRELARDGIPMILQQPVCSGIFAVEMDMIQRDTEAPMVPYHPAAHHPVFARLAQWTRGTSPVGAIEQVVMERSLADRSDESVRAELARDAILLRRLLGKFQRVGAMPAKEIKTLNNLSVQLTGEAKAIGRWTVGPTNERAGATLSLIGEQGRITLTIPDARADWRLESTSADLPSETLPPLDEKEHAQSILMALQGKPSSPTWEDAFRATDLADLACESVRRGKTLPVSNERLTEEDTFKGIMAAGGCLIILVIPFLLLFVSLFDGLEIPRDRTTRLTLAKGEREITLPADVEAVDYIQRTNSKQPLPAMSKKDLFLEHGTEGLGEPAAYHLGRNSITMAPAADGDYEFIMAYEGSFRIWRGWPLLLLSPIVIFLCLQLFKLVFPPQTKTDAE